MSSVKTRIGKSWMKLYDRPIKKTKQPVVQAPSYEEQLRIVERRIKKQDKRK